MRLTESQKKTVMQLPVDENVTFGGVASDYTHRYEIHRVTAGEYKVAKFALMICLDVEYVSSPAEVISFCERSWD